MADLPDALDHNVGPFPVVGWLAIGAAGIGLAIVIRRSSIFGGSGNVAPIDAVDETTGDPTAAGELIGSTGQMTTIPIAPQTQPQAARPTTNQAWHEAAVRWAVGAGEDSILAEQAVTHYLNGTQMSNAAGNVLRRILTTFGPPPEGAPTPDIAPAPTVPRLPNTPTTRPPATAPKPGYREVRYGVVGQSYPMRDVARRYAPAPTNPDSVEATLRRIVALNPKLSGVARLPGGYLLRIPA